MKWSPSIRLEEMEPEPLRPGTPPRSTAPRRRRQSDNAGSCRRQRPQRDRGFVRARRAPCRLAPALRPNEGSWSGPAMRCELRERALRGPAACGARARPGAASGRPRARRGRDAACSTPPRPWPAPARAASPGCPRPSRRAASSTARSSISAGTASTGMPAAFSSATRLALLDASNSGLLASHSEIRHRPILSRR